MAIDPNPRAVEATRKAIADELYALRGYPATGRVVDRLTDNVISAYFAAVAKERFNQRIAPHTRAMAATKVGDVVTVEVAYASILRSAARTARDLMTNPKARWSFLLLEPGHYRITRTPDGAPPRRDPWDNLAAVELARLHVGQSKTFNWPGTSSLSSYRKVAARRLLNNKTADWTAKTTTHGIKVTRIA